MKTDSYSAFARRAVELAVFATAVVVLSCANPSGPGDSVVGEAMLAKGGGGGGEVTVSATKPDTGSQGTTLDVTISGSGFASDMAATWELDGVADPTQVRTNSTRYVSSKQLVANVTITEGATVAKWDVRVTSTKCCKGGIGIELFEVKVRGVVDTDPRVFVEWDDQVNVAAPGGAQDWRPAGITGDARDRFGVASTVSSYQGNFCGVRAKIYMANGGGDLVINPGLDYSTGLSQLCGAKRGLRFYFNYLSGGDRGSATLLPAPTNVRGAGVTQTGEYGPPFVVGEPQERPLGFGVGSPSSKTCERMRFWNEYAAGYPGVRDVLVTRLDDAGTAPDGSPIRRWRVESQYPHMAVCITPRGKPSTSHYLPFAFTATEVPYPYPSYP